MWLKLRVFYDSNQKIFSSFWPFVVLPFVALLTLCRLTLCRLTLCRLTLCRLTLCRLTLCRLTLCRWIQSFVNLQINQIFIFNILHVYSTQSGVEGSFFQGKNNLNIEVKHWSSNQKCPPLISRSSNLDYEHPTQKFSSLYIRVSRHSILR